MRERASSVLAKSKKRRQGCVGGRDVALERINVHVHSCGLLMLLSRLVVAFIVRTTWCGKGPVAVYTNSAHVMSCVSPISYQWSTLLLLFSDHSANVMSGVLRTSFQWSHFMSDDISIDEEFVCSGKRRIAGAIGLSGPTSI